MRKLNHSFFIRSLSLKPVFSPQRGSLLRSLCPRNLLLALVFLLNANPANAIWIGESITSSTVSPNTAVLDMTLINMWDDTEGFAFARAESHAIVKTTISVVLSPLPIFVPFVWTGMLTPGSDPDFPSIEIVSINGSVGGPTLAVTNTTVEATSEAFADSPGPAGHSGEISGGVSIVSSASAAGAHSEGEGIPGWPFDLLTQGFIRGLFDFEYDPDAAAADTQTGTSQFEIGVELDADGNPLLTPNSTNIDDFLFGFFPLTNMFTVSGNITPGITINGPGTLTIDNGLIGELRTTQAVMQHVPEPETLLLFVTSIMFVAWRRKIVSRCT